MQTSALLEISGTLLRSAEVRNRIIDHDGHSVPVVCVELELDNTAKTQVHAEQRFAAGQHTQANAAAKRLVQGVRITLHCAVAEMRLFSGNTTHIHVVPT